MTPDDAYALIDNMPREQRLILAVAYEILRKAAPSEQYEVARAATCREFLEGFGVRAADRLIFRWSMEGVR